MKAPRDFATEAELAAAVVAHHRAAGFEVYQEVEGHGGVADIVATRAGRVRVVECKIVFGAEVLGQVWGWKPVAHELCIAAPRRSRGHGGTFLQLAAERFGIGIFEVWRDFEGAVHVLERAPALEQNGNATKLLASLRVEHGFARQPRAARKISVLPEKLQPSAPGLGLRQAGSVGDERAHGPLSRNPASRGPDP